MIRSVLTTLKLAIILISTVVVGFGGVSIFDHYRTQAEDEAGIGDKIVVTVKTDDVDDTADILKKKGLIRSTQVFALTVKYVDRDIKPATYDLTRGMSVSTIVDLITTEKSKAVTKVEQLKLTVVEGWRTEQIADELDKIGYPPGGDAFLRAVKDYPHDNYDFLDGTRKNTLEGFLFPLTYTFDSDADPDEIITMMLNAFDENFTPNMRKRADQMNLSLYDVVKVAALVERETAVQDERQLVADVYLKRYDADMQMQADPTVSYLMGKVDGKWWPVPKPKDLQIDSPMNLYLNKGFGPQPICNPRQLSLQAVLDPANSPFYFFTARNDGSGRHLFATNNDEQNANQQLVDSGADLSEFDSEYLQYLPSSWIPSNSDLAMNLAAYRRED
jgi:UPF0755 protein